MFLVFKFDFKNRNRASGVSVYPGVSSHDRPAHRSGQAAFVEFAFADGRRGQQSALAYLSWPEIGSQQQRWGTINGIVYGSKECLR